MGVAFYIGRVNRRKLPSSEVALPEIEARFAATEYPRFLAALAHGSGMGDAWDAYQAAISDLSKALAKQVFADFDPERPFGYRNKKERRKANKKAKRDGKPREPEVDPEIEVLRGRVEEARLHLESLTDIEPLVSFLLAPLDGGFFDSDACRVLGPRIRSVAERWEEAPKGWVGWLEHALEIARAMDIAAEHPDLVVGISG